MHDEIVFQEKICFFIRRENWGVDPLILCVSGGGENNEWTNIQQMNGPFTLWNVG